MLTDVFFPDTIGGAGRVAFHLAKELVSKGHSVDVITRNPDTRYQSFQIIEGIGIYRFTTPPNESFGLVYSEIKGSYSLLNRLIERTDFDLVCVHQCMAAIGPYFNRLIKNKPIMYFFHSPWSLEFLTKRKDNTGANSFWAKAVARVMHRIEKRMVSKASEIVVLSSSMQDRVQSMHRKSTEHISIIPAGIDLNHFNLASEDKYSIKSRFDLPLDKTVFLTVRNLVPRMGIENLIECFHKSDTLKDNGYLLIGGSGFYEDYLLSLVQSYRLQAHIKFLGHIDEKALPEIYQAADFFVLPTSELEGFGLVILEAMACGTPVLGTPVGAIPEILNRFDERLVFEGTGWNEMKIKLERIIEKPKQYEFDPKDCRHFVEQNYSWKKMADAFEQEALNLISMKNSSLN